MRLRPVILAAVSLIALSVGPCRAADISIHLDISQAGRRYDGLGVVESYGKLLYDYPEPYRSHIMDYLYKPGYGASLQILKVELGHDGNNTATAWPGHRRTLGERNDFDRGWVWWFMKEARRRNPEIILSALHWGYPAWAQSVEQKAAFVVDFVEGAWEAHGLRIDYIGGNQNETTITPRVTKHIRRMLDQRGFRDVKIIAADEGARLPRFRVFDQMASDADYAAAVDVVGVHYKSRPADFMPEQAYTFGKPLWSSEDGGGTWNSWRAGAQWVRQIMMLLGEVEMTGVIRWLSTASAYDNMPWPASGIMRTKEPWSGNYTVGANLWGFAHFTQFVRPGWRIMDIPAMQLHSPLRGCLMAFCDPATGDWSAVMDLCGGDITDRGVDLALTVGEGLKGDAVCVWRSDFRGDERGWFVRCRDVQPDSSGVVSLHLDKGCIYSISTTRGQGRGNAAPAPAEEFALPYSDDFESYGMGRPPRYFVDANAIFETAPAGGGRGGMALRQVIADSPQLWHPGSKHTAQPVTEMGGMEWTDYRACVDVLLETAGRVAMGCRIDPKTTPSADYGLEGYWITLSEKGEWELFVRRFDKKVILKASGNITGFGTGRWATMSMELRGNRITASINGRQLASFEDDSVPGGNMALATLAPGVTDFVTPTDRYTIAQFDNLNIMP